LDTLSSGRSKRSDPTFEQELTDLVKDANLRGNERERKHAYAVQLFADRLEINFIISKSPPLKMPKY